MCATVVATPFSPGTANNSPTTSAPANTSVMNPLRRLRCAFAASTGGDWEGWAELTVHASGSVRSDVGAGIRAHRDAPMIALSTARIVALLPGDRIPESLVRDHSTPLPARS